MKRVVKSILCTIILSTMITANVLAAETDGKIVYDAPAADGVDSIPYIAPRDDSVGSKYYTATEFSVGVYIKGAPFNIPAGSILYDGANQIAIDSSKTADVSYQALDYDTNQVLHGIRKVGNLTAQIFDAGNKTLRNKTVKLYLHCNNGYATSASGKVIWF